jgi:DNA-binding NtrC family response regulator
MPANARVLVVDGEESVRGALFRALLERDVFCDCASSGGDAIVRLSERPYAMVVLDFSLPHAGAAAVVESLRVLPSSERPMVIATAVSIDSARESDTDLVQMILRRPVNISDVAGMIGSCLAQARTA